MWEWRDEILFPAVRDVEGETQPTSLQLIKKTLVMTAQPALIKLGHQRIADNVFLSISVLKSSQVVGRHLEEKVLFSYNPKTLSIPDESN